MGTRGRESTARPGGPDGLETQSLVRAEVRRQLRVRLGAGGVRRVICTDGDDGPDLLTVLAELAPRTPALLVEPEAVLARHARAAASALGLKLVQVRTADPAAWDTYGGWRPADLLLTGGVLGQADDAAVPTVVSMLPTLLAPRGLVIWTREGPGREDPSGSGSGSGSSSGEHVRRELVRGGFDEVLYAGVPGTTYRVGVHRLAVPPRDGVPGSRLVPAVNRPVRDPG